MSPTCPLREVNNQILVIQEIKKLFKPYSHFYFELASPQREAELTFLGVQDTITNPLILDLGGGIT